MKNILKKLGVLGLTIAVLSPFIELPNVNAATTEICNIHLQSYLFLDEDGCETENCDVKQKIADKFSQYKDDGYTTYANFPRVFKESENIEILDVTTDYVDTSSKLTRYWNLYNMAMASPNYYSGGTDSLNGRIFVTGSSKDYVDNTILTHYIWARYDQNGYIIDDWNVTNVSQSSLTVQGALAKNTSDDSKRIVSSNVEIRPATYTNVNNSGNFTDNTSYTDLKTYFTYIANAEEESYVPLKITRKLNSSQLTDTEIDDGTYYWPVVLNVEYQTCEVTDQWAVEYDDNVDDTSVTNLPSTQTATVGTDIKISTDKPSRSGYVFKKWCETSNGSGTCYNAGDTITSPSSATTVKLYAQWGESGAANNEKTGVVSYIIGFAAVGVVAGSIYLISKKKNLFKQI